MLPRATKERKIEKDRPQYNKKPYHQMWLKLKAKCDQMQQAIDIMEKEFVDYRESWSWKWYVLL